MKTKLKIIFLLLALLFVPTSNAYAQSPSGDVIRFGENYTLKSGEILNGSLVVIGGNVDVEKDALVNRDVVLIGGNLTVDGDTHGAVVIIGGNATISGTTSQDVVVIGGQLLLTKTAIVKGDVVTMGGQVTKEPGAQVTGNMVNNAPPIAIPDIPNVPNVPNTPGTPHVNVNFNPFWEMTVVLGRALAVAAIAMLLTLFMQPQLERVAGAIVHQPAMAAGFGLLTLVLTPLVLVIMVITLILIPVALIVAFVLPLAWLFGIIALGQEVGERFTTAINQSWAPVLATGFGTFLLLLVGGLVGLIPCVGWLIPFLVGLVAVGGVVLTWFGTRSTPTTITPVVQVPPTA
jgi:cytoskeletal protein CcmA (bactofilin family)